MIRKKQKKAPQASEGETVAWIYLRGCWGKIARGRDPEAAPGRAENLDRWPGLAADVIAAGLDVRGAVERDLSRAVGAARKADETACKRALERAFWRAARARRVRPGGVA